MRIKFEDLPWTFYVILTTILSFHCNADDLPTCQPKDFHYEFTECDDEGGRWRVSVPSPETCTGGAPNAPIRVSDCKTSCEAGTYFNYTSLKCVKCPPGTYSLGGGVIFDSWETLPTGFHVVTENFQSNFRALLPKVKDESLKVDCSKFGWKTSGEYIESDPAPCTSLLTYTVKLVKPGLLIYTYQYVDDSVVFQFQAQNDQCQSFEDAEQSRWPLLTDEGKWHSVSVPLKTGLNVLQWKTIGMSAEGLHRHSKAVLIGSIEISGMAYTSECLPCRNGTHSGEGSKECELCPINYYSSLGSSDCRECMATHYAAKGSAKCLLREPCTDKDYYQVHGSCDANKKTEISYKWIEPKICNDLLRNSVKLPDSLYLDNCLPCNPGMHYTSNNTGGCEFCDQNEFSNGIDGCQSCPLSTAPNYGYQFIRWHEMPPGMEATCMSITGDGCRTAKGWQVAKDYIHSGIGHTEDAYLVLSLNVPGFRTQGGGIVNGKPVEVGTISFTFELVCKTDCEFVFMQESITRGASIIQTWNRTNAKGKQHFKYVVTQNDTYLFSWAYQKRSTWVSFNGFRPSAVETTSVDGDSNESRAIIHTINVTNTINGGASVCLACPKGSERQGCIPCPAGQYVDVNSTECKKCPKDTFVSDPYPYGIESCQPCGQGLKSDAGKSCYSDCNIDINNRHYDLTSLEGFHRVRGSRLFTSSGTEYFHEFNVSLCGFYGQGNTICVNNLTSKEYDKYSENVRATICRSTSIPMKTSDGSNSVITAQSISLGDHLIGITTDSTYSNIEVISEFQHPKNRHNDVHFFYSSPTTTHACPSGRSTTITLRCDVSATGRDNITLPPSCPDGTCDGCTFHFLWRTHFACPICSTNDYEIVSGECVNGIQSIHYIAVYDCLLPEELKQQENNKRHCSSIPEEVQVVIGCGAFIAFLLIILVFYFWKKNRKLEYKYMKMVQSSSSKDGDLPPAESCALHDDEEDQFDNEQFLESKSKVLFSKLRSMAGPKEDTSQPFESLHLTETDNVA
ncbi:hypothetical protein CHUAL_002249 [Chamberlinius hualienensis]